MGFSSLFFKFSSSNLFLLNSHFILSSFFTCPCHVCNIIAFELKEYEPFCFIPPTDRGLWFPWKQSCRGAELVPAEAGHHFDIRTQQDIWQQCAHQCKCVYIDAPSRLWKCSYKRFLYGCYNVYIIFEQMRLALRIPMHETQKKLCIQQNALSQKPNLHNSQ